MWWWVSVVFRCYVELFLLQIEISTIRVYWYYGKAPPSTTAKTTISNVLTIYMMATMYSFTRDPTLLHGGARGGAIDIYNWLVARDLLNPETGYQRDTLETADEACELQGGVNIINFLRNFPSIASLSSL